MQAARLPLLRLGWQFKGHEVALPIPYSNNPRLTEWISAFIKNTLPRFARENPQIEITVSPRPRKHPVIRGHYINGREKAICVRNMPNELVLQKAELLRDASGDKLKRVTKPVNSINESVRGIWSPYHGARYRI